MPVGVVGLTVLLLSYLAFIGLTVSGSWFLSKTVGQGVGVIIWILLQRENLHWRQSRFWNGPNERVQLWSGILIWFILVTGYLWIRDFLSIFLGLCGTIFITSVVVSISWLPSLPKLENIHNIYNKEFNKNIGYLSVVYFLLIGLLFWISLISIIGLPHETTSTVTREVVIFLLSLFLPLIIGGFVLLILSLWPPNGWPYINILVGPIYNFIDILKDEIAVIQNEEERTQIARVGEEFDKRIEKYVSKSFFWFFVLIFGGFLLSLIIKNNFGLSITQVFILLPVMLESALIIITFGLIVDVKREDFSNTTIRKFLQRSIINIIAGSIFAVLLAYSLFLLINSILSWYIQNILSEPLSLVSTQTIQIISESNGLQLSEYLELANFEQIHVWYIDNIAFFLFRITLPIVFIILLTPVIVMYIYLRSIRSLGIAIISFIMISILNFIGHSLITGGIAQLGQVSVQSLLPTVILGLGEKIGAWFKDLWGYIDCPYPECDEQIEADSNSCPYCENPLAECPHCNEITQASVDRCIHCGETLSNNL